MDWQLIVLITISVGSLVAFFAMGERPEPKAPGESRSQRVDAVQFSPARQPDPEIVRRFTAALKP